MSMLRTAARGVSRSAVAQRRFTCEKVNENPDFDASKVTVNQAEWPVEFRQFDSADPYKNCKDVTAWSAWGLVWIAVQLQLVLVFGEGEPEFQWVTKFRKYVE
eukprot:TRINITY_DN875_c0_g3_i1.p1 TRINITY_DN875_c0_g3~~TRINITY_DN875_c0_g3_i1.p1  ORF type:complete len:103 (+),score=22.82 TRINITY_DN875_c0_g3_i1:67-375(+)